MLKHTTIDIAWLAVQSCLSSSYPNGGSGENSVYVHYGGGVHYVCLGGAFA